MTEPSWSDGFRVGIAFQTDKTPAEYEALADVVDRYGFDVVTVYNDLYFQPALGPLLLMARRVKRASIGPSALNPFTVHPVEIAGQAALLDHASNGRAYLGLVRGAWLESIGFESKRPVTALREAAEVVQRLLAGESAAYRGKVFHLPEGARLKFPVLRARVPIVIGTWGPETARVAGAVADEIKIGGSANPALVAHLRPHLEHGSARAGRPAGSVGVCLGAVSVVDEDRAAARALARREVAMYLPVVAPLDPSSDPEWLARIQAAARRRDFEAIARDVSDEVLDRFAYAGTPSDVVENALRARAAGASRVELGTPHGLSSAEGIRLLGERVLPALKEA